MMTGGMAQKMRVRSAMEHDGTVELGRYQMMTSGNGVGGTIPKEHARVLGLLEIGATDVFVNYELGVVMHKIPEGDGEE